MCFLSNVALFVCLLCALFSFCSKKSVKVCQNNRKLSKRFGKDIHYHCFPREPKIRQKWIEQCKRVEPFNPDTSQICSVHFTPQDYLRDLKSELLKLKPKHRLKPDAIPTLHLDVPVEWYPRTKTKRHKDAQDQTHSAFVVHTNLLVPTTTVSLSIKPEPEDDGKINETLLDLNQVFLPETVSVSVKEEINSEGQEKEIVVQQVKANLEFDPLNPYDILQAKYNQLLKENAKLKEKLRDYEDIIEGRKREYENFEEMVRKMRQRR